MKEKVLHFLSYFTDRRFKLNEGVSTSDSFTLKEPLSQERIEKAQAKGKVVYDLREPKFIGSFELMDVIKKNDKVVYRLRHTLTGEVIDFNKTAFDLFFQLRRNNQ